MTQYDSLSKCFTPFVQIFFMGVRPAPVEVRVSQTVDVATHPRSRCDLLTGLLTKRRFRRCSAMLQDQGPVVLACRAPSEFARGRS